MEFTQRQINICTVGDPDLVDGFVSEESGLGYWLYGAEEDGTGGWYVPTHLASGFRVPTPDMFAQEEHVRTFIEKIAPLTDWRASPQELLPTDEDLRKIAKQCCELFYEACWDDDMKAFAAEMRETLPLLSNEDIQNLANHC